MIRELVARFNRTLTERRVSVRRNYHVPVKVRFAPEKNTAKLTLTSEDVFMSGETTDVSETGIGFIVSSIRIKEKYLVGQDRLLNVELDVGSRRIRMQVMGRRYERVGVHLSMEKYLIGAEIIGVNENDKLAYEHFLQYGNKIPAGVVPDFGLSLD